MTPTTATATWLAPTSGTTPFTFTVQWRLLGTTPWTNNAGGPTQQLTQQVTGLDPVGGKTYELQVRVDNVTGVPNFSDIVQFTTPLAAPPPPPGESADGTLITTVAVGGLPAIVNAINEQWTITASAQVAVNGVTDTTTNGLLSLFYIGHRVYQEASNTNALGLTPGWWSKAVASDPWVDSADPTTVSPPPITGTGPGPAASGTFINVDFANLTLPTGKTSVVVHPQLFGVSSGGFDNNNWQHLGEPQFINAMRALNLPLFRVHSQWQAKGNSLSTLAAKIGQMVPSTCTMIIGLNTPSTGQAQSAIWRTQTTGPQCTLWEEGNEHGYDQPGINTQIASLKLDNALNRMAGDVNAGVDNGHLLSMVNAMSAATLGLLDQHQYLYCRGLGDPIPSNAAACLADGFYRGIATSLDSTISSGYGANLPYLIGEYNLECGASNAELRSGTSIGACFLASSLLGLQDSTNRTMYGAIWDLMDDSGAAYNLIEANTFNLYPQYYTLQRLIRNMPGTMVNCSSGSAAGGVKAWATFAAGTFGVCIINSNSTPRTGPVALSHWPLNATGNANITQWTYPTTSSLVNPVPNVPGVVSTLSVVGGMTANVTVPGNSLVILSVN